MNSSSRFKDLISEAQMQVIQMIHQRLTEHQIPYQFTGGFAALFYGANRKLVDIDVDVQSTQIQNALKLFPEFSILLPLGRYCGENWDIKMVTLQWGDVIVDLCSGDLAQCRPSVEAPFMKVPFRLHSSKHILLGDHESGEMLSVISQEDLISYKDYLKREVDQLDVDAITILKQRRGS